MSTAGFDELIEFLLDKISLRGSEGGSYKNISDWCQEFYSAENTLLSSTPLTVGGLFFATQTWPSAPPTIDTTLYRKIWEWLVEHPDVKVEERDEEGALAGNGLDRSQGQHLLDGIDPVLSAVDGQAPIEEVPASNRVLCPGPRGMRGLYLQTTEERMWLSLTGHAPDLTRVRALEFQLLSIIAGFGELGVSQPDLVAISGQDKRSLPKRTDELHNRGYIEKKPVLAHGTRTSLCTFARFVKQPALSNALAEQTGVSRDEDECFRDGMIINDKFYDKTMSIIKEFGVITHTDFRRRLGLIGKRWQSRATFRNLRRMDRLGCIRKVSAPAFNRQGKAIYVRSIKYIGDPGESKRQDFIKHKRTDSPSLNPLENDASSGEDEDVDEAEDDLDDGDAVLDPQYDMAKPPEQSTIAHERTVPQVDMRQPLTNYLYDLIDSSGPKGMTSMDLHETAFGGFFKRPTDQIMSHLTDIWQESQPSHLRHLAVIRDAAVFGKYSHYTYRTYDNFAAAVVRSEVSWEAIDSAYQIMTKASKKAGNTSQPIQALDSWGFPIIPAGDFVNSGSATMNTCRLGALKAQRRGGSGGRGRGGASGKPLGRPRKYPRGEQPSKSEKPAKKNQQTPKKAFEAGQSSNALTEESVETPPLKRFKTGTGASLPTPKTFDSAESGINDGVITTVGIPLTGSSYPTEIPSASPETFHLKSKKRMAAQDGNPASTPKRQKTTKSKLLEESPQPGDRPSPGVYRIPARRLTSSGRPRKSMTFVFKSTRMADFAWFEPSLNTDSSHTVATHIHDSPTSVAAPLQHDTVVTPAPSFEGAAHDELEIRTPETGVNKRIDIPHATRIIASPNTVEKSIETTIEDAFPPKNISHDSTVDSDTDQDLEPVVHKDSQSDAQNSQQSRGSPARSLRSEASLPREVLHDGSLSSATLSPQAPSPVDDVRMQPMATDVEMTPAPDAEKTPAPDGTLASSAVNGTAITNQAHDPPKMLKKPQYKRKQGVTLGRGVVEFKKSKIILDIMTEAGGVYPGDRELWYPFTTEVQKTNPTERPDPKTVARAVKNVIDSGRLKKFAFAFKSKNGVVTTKHILALPHMNSQSKVVRDLEKRIIEAEGKILHYLPAKPYVNPALRIHAEKDAQPIHGGGMRPLPKDDTMPVTRIPLESKPKAKSKPSWAAWAIWAKATKKKSVTVHLEPSEDEEDGDEDEVITADQASMQATFQLTKYDHTSTLIPPKKRYSRLASLIHWEDKNNPKAQYKSSLAPGIIRNRRFGRRTADAAKKNSTGTIFWQIVRTATVHSSPREMSTGSLKLTKDILLQQTDNAATAWVAQRTTLTRTAQVFHHATGTFSSNFVIPRRQRPQLKIQPNLMRSFEERLPQSIEDIGDQDDQGGHKSTYTSQIEREIEQVQRWEQDHEEELTSDIQLVVPRFISYNLKAEVRPEPTSFPVRDSNYQGQTQTSYGPTRSVLPCPPSEIENSASVARKTAKRSTLRGSAISSEVPNVPLHAAASTKKTRKYRTAPTFSESQSQRFIATILTVRTLLGGVDRFIEWSLVQRLLPGDLSFNLLKRRWTAAQVNCRLQFAKLEKELQDNYIKAVEEWQLPMIDYGDVKNYDWEQVVEWAQLNMQFPPGDLLPELPVNRNILEDYYDVLPEKDPYEVSKEDVYVPWSTVIKREEVLTDLSFSLPLRLRKDASTLTRRTTAELEEDKLELAKSLVRANIFTPPETYRPAIARALLMPLGTDLLDKALAELLALKMFKVENKGRLVPGRNYSVNEQFLGGLRKGCLDPDDIFRPALRYKTALDTILSRDGTTILSPAAGDGQMLAIINMIAAGRLNITLDIPPVTELLPGETEEADASRAISLWGFTEANYKTKQLNRDNFHFAIRLSPSTTYSLGTPLRYPLPPPPAKHVHNPAELRVPLWYDIHGGLLPAMWDTMLSIVSSAVALRPGIDGEGISKMCKGGMAVFEAEWTLAWLRDVGVLRRLSKGWCAGEWWWCVFGVAGGDEGDAAAAMLDLARDGAHGAHGEV